MGDVMKNKGFTLIELLAVLVILSILALIVIPSVTGTIANSRESAYEKQIQVLETAAKKWGIENVDKIKPTFNLICVLQDDADDSGTITIGDKYSCDPGDGISRIFYVLEQDDNNISLIMDRNIDDNYVVWNLDGGNVPTKAMQALEDSTTEWSYVTTTLPTGQQIATTSIDTGWDSKIDNSIGNLPPWIYGTIPYWTSDYWSDNSSDTILVWYVETYDCLELIDYNLEEYVGIRPVIISKKNDVLSVDFEQLYKSGQITEYPVINPKTKEELEGCILVTYNKKYKQYEYKYTSDNTKCES